MSQEVKRSRWDHWPAAWYALILRIGVIAALAYLLYRVGFIIVMVLMAVMLALTVAPLVDWLCRCRPIQALPRAVRRGVASTIVFLGLAAAIVGLLVLIMRPLVKEVTDFVTGWPEYQRQLEARLEWGREQYEQLPPGTRQWVEEQGSRWVKEQGAKDLGSLITYQTQHLLHRTVDWGMLFVEMILIPVLAFSFLTESRPLKREYTNFIPAARVRDGLYLLRQTGTILQSYAIGQLILALIAGVVVWLLMTALQIPNAMALALIAAVTRVIPVIGPILGGIPIVLISTLRGWEQGLAVLIAFSVMHLIESKVVMPRLIGHRINLHPALVIIVLLIGAEFFGMWGMFLAAPVAAVVKVMLHHFFVRPRRKPGGGPRLTPKAPVAAKEVELERPAIAGVGSHSRAH